MNLSLSYALKKVLIQKNRFLLCKQKECEKGEKRGEETKKKKKKETRIWCVLVYVFVL